ncbi:MAG: beta-galactosidase [Capsulimonadaceae bacterium]|nr:beta-galactosidase [Capsulimonadaceae bacterium]
MPPRFISLPLFAASAAMALIALVPTLASANGLTARVKTIDGVPRLVVNGKITRPRIFWGGPGSSSIPIAAGEQSLSFTFSPVLSEPSTATLHLRFEHKASKVVVKSVHLVDLTTGSDVIPETHFRDQAEFDKEWAFWPANAPGVNGSVSVLANGGVELAQWKPDAGKEWADKHIYHKPDLALDESHQYKLDITVTSDTPSMGFFSFYRPGQTYVFLAGVSDSFKDQISLAAKSGVNIISFINDMPWAKPGETQDTAAIDTTIRTILKTNPKAIILPRIYLRPPTWWLDAHPADEMRWMGAKEQHRRGPTVASESFREDASAQLVTLINHLESTFGDHMIGYHVAGQNTDEWFYQDSWGPDWNGYAEADTIAFRKWLTAKYGSDAALKASWRKDDVTLANASVPTPSERQGGDSDLRDPATQQNVIDFTLFQQDNIADCVCHFAHVVRTATHGNKLSVFFYGYAYEFGGAQNGPANAGHYAMRRLLDSPDIDAIASPWSYFDRGLHGSGPIMVTADSVALAGKLYIAEDDTATAKSSGNAPGSDVRMTTAEETNQVLMRNSAEVALRNIATWWMDLGRAGWFDDPAYWMALDTFAPVEQSQLANARPFHPEIASVVDEKSVPLLAWHGHAGSLLGDSRAALGRAGAPYGQYLQDDVAAGKVHAKLFVFLTAYRMPQAQRASLLKAAQGATRIWCYAPGYFDGDAASLAAVKQTTGFDVKLLASVQAIATPTEAGNKLGLTTPFGVGVALRPTLAVTDATPAETLATYPDGSVAVAMRKTPTGTSIFVGPPRISAELVRMAARNAGVHLFTQTDATVFANGPFLTVHATTGGPLTIDTGKDSEIVDVISGAKLGKGPGLTLPVAAGDTRVLRY